VLERAAADDAVLNERSDASEDVSFFLNEVPGLYFNLGIVPRDQDLAKAAPDHSPSTRRRWSRAYGRWPWSQSTISARPRRISIECEGFS
jgi:hypothetical protein